MAVAAVALLGVLALLAPAHAADGSTAGAASGGSTSPRPLLYDRGFPDPTVVESRVGLVGAATAPDINIGRSPVDVGPVERPRHAGADAPTELGDVR